MHSDRPVRSGPQHSDRPPRLGALRIGALVCLAVLLVGFIAYLLGHNYMVRLEQQRRALDGHARRTAEIGLTLEYFFYERRLDLQDLAERGAVPTYFSNRALGMSMEYGLQLSLEAIATDFERVIRKKQVSGQSIYEFLALQDEAHTMLVAQDRYGEVEDPNLSFVALRPAVESRIEQSFLICSDRVPEAVGVATPCFFGGEYVGRVLAVLRPQSLLAQLGRDRLVAPDRVWLAVGQVILGNGAIAERGSGRGSDPPANAPSTAQMDLLAEELAGIELEPQRPTIIRLHHIETKPADYVALLSPVAGTPFNVIHVAPVGELMPGPAPWRVFVGLVALALATLLGVTLVVRGATKSLILTARLDQESRQHQAALERKEQLSREIAQRRRAERELRRAIAIAENSARSKSMFLANMSHEIRTPMNGIIGMTDLLLTTDLTAEQASYARIVQNSGEALLTLLNDILDLSKIDAGKVDIVPELFDLRESLQPALEPWRVRAEEKGLAFTVEFDDGVPRQLWGDVARIRQILTNLVGNAIKFTERGEIRVSAERAAGKDGQVIRYAVRDTGIGIPEEKQEIIFQAFEQADGSTTRKYGGTGLGLTISSRLAHLMGGRLEVESSPGEGSLFRLVLPVAKPLAAAVSAATGPAAAVSASETPSPEIPIDEVPPEESGSVDVPRAS